MLTIKFEDYFFGTKISKEEKESGYISFQTLFNELGGGILCNDITTLFGVEINSEYHEENQINGDCDTDIYSYYIISPESVMYYQSLTNYPIFYIDFLHLYMLGITHYGTLWKSVNTDIQIGKEYTLNTTI